MLCLPLEDSALQLLWHHKEVETQGEQLQFLDSARVSLLGICAQIQWRFLLPFGVWPYSLLPLGDASVSAVDKSRIAQQIFDEKLCCLDYPFTRKLRVKFANANDFLADQDLRNMIESWSKFGKVCSLHIERQFALIRSSVPDSPPFAERVSSSGFLAQLCQKQREAGGLQATTFRRRDAIELGAPLLSNIEAATACPGRARGHIALINKRMSEAVSLAGKKIPREEAADIRRKAALEYRSMAADDQQDLRCEARASAAANVTPTSAAAGPPQYDSSLLWGAGCRTCPVSTDAATHQIQQETGCQTVI